jgi:signal transduction histidine kinase/CheY-like chemotaxis protein
MSKKLNEARINEFIEVIMNVAMGDYSVQLKISEENNYFDALAMGINMMVDDIRKSHETELENDRITILNTELRKAKEQAEESDRLKSAFLANMSHEIRTPMNGILGFADLLKEPELSVVERQEYIGIIEKSGLRMLNIINDLIDISKIESGQMEILNSDINVNQQIEYIFNFFKPEVEKKGMQIFFEIGLPSEKAFIRTDREKLYAILTNLVKNAIKYSDSGSIEIGYTVKDKYLEFYVIDAGIGIPHNKKEIIFDRFIQADISDKRAFQGAGLGLAISKSYVEMLGGKIWVESDEGIGSSFHFTIPYLSDQGEKTVIEKINSDIVIEQPVKKLKILIAEDDENSEMLLTLIVKEYCKEDFHARTGREAVEVCRQHPDIDLILMDIQMPEMNGYYATREIRKFNEKVVIIAQTAYALKDDREKAIESGCNDYISKPISQAVLQDLVNKHFNK